MSHPAHRFSRRPGMPPPRRQRGLAAVELALIAPVIVLMVVGGIDLYRYIQAKSVLDRVVFTIAHEFSQTPGLPYGAQCNGNRSADFSACGARLVAQSLLAPLDAGATDLHVAVYQWTQAPNGWTPCWPAAGAGTAPDPARFPAEAPVGSKLVAVMTSYRYAGYIVPDTTLFAHANVRATGAHASTLCQ